MAGQPRKTLKRVTKIQELLSEAGDTFYEMTPREYFMGTCTGTIVDVWFQLSDAIEKAEKHSKRLTSLLEKKIYGCEPPRAPQPRATPLPPSEPQEPPRRAGP